MDDFGKNLIWIGLLIVVLGVIIHFASHSGHRLPFRIGRLPGDIEYHGRNTTIFFPIVTCIVISVVLTLIMWLVNSARK
jgi:uncharacterized membrane protein